MPTARASIGSALGNGLAYVVGGVNGDGATRLATVESYNPAANTWTSEAPLLVGKSEVSVGLAGSTILATDGYTTSGDTGDNEGYNAAANTWKSLASDPNPRHDSCYGVINGLMYIAGGGLSPSALNESYGVSSNKWTTLSAMPVATTAPGSATWNGQLYCFGGGDSTGPTGGNFYSNVQIYQP
jgi:N-acetylneuraminic acid mutarotase